MVETDKEIRKEKNFDGDFLTTAEGLRKDTDKNPNTMEKLLTNSFLMKTGVCFFGAILVGFSLSKKMKLLEHFQNSIIATLYVGNCSFYPVEPLIYANIL